MDNKKISVSDRDEETMCHEDTAYENVTEVVISPPSCESDTTDIVPVSQGELTPCDSTQPLPLSEGVAARRQSKYSARLKKLVLGALFVALAYVVRLVIPPIDVMFLSFEFKDAVIAIGAMYLGPIWAVAMSALVALLEFLTLSSTGVYGMIMNFAAAATFTVTASLIYKFNRTLWGAAAGVGTGVLALVAVMLPLNLWVTPYFMGTTVDTVVSLIPKVLLPFNAGKGIMNAGISLLLYKPVMTAFKHAKLAESRGSVGGGTPSKKNTWISLALSVGFIALGAVVFFVFLHGNFGKIEY